MKRHPSDVRNYLVVAIAGYATLAAVSFLHSPPYLAAHRPPADVYERDHALAILFFGAMTVLSLWHLLAFLRIRRVQFRDGSLLTGLLAVGVIALVAPPFFSTDPFAYLEGARTLFIHRLNPYLFSYADFRDAFSPWTIVRQPHVYGPMNFIVSGPAAILSEWNVPGAVYFLKASGLATHVANVLLLGFLVEKDAKLRPGLFLYAMHPLVITEQVMSAHNEGLGVLFMLTAILAERRGMAAAATLAAIAAPLVKAPFIVLPFFLLAYRVRERRYAQASMLVAGGAAVAVTLRLTFLPTSEAVANLFNPAGFRDLRGIQVYLGSIAHGAGWSPDPYRAVHRLIFPACSAIVGAFAFWRAARLRTLDDLGDACGWVFLLTLLFIVQFWPWYVTWCLPFAALTRSERLRWAILVFGVSALFSYVPIQFIPDGAPRTAVMKGIPQTVPLMVLAGMAILRLLRSRSGWPVFNRR